MLTYRCFIAEQEGGVPRILLKAHEATSEQRKASGSQEEDEVVVVDTTQARKAYASVGATNPQAANDVIEIS